MEKELNINEIMNVQQLPIIFQQLEVVGKYVDEELEKVKDLECNEENKNEVKKVRANINATLKQFEDARKSIKNQVLDAYNQFNDKYEDEVKTKLQNASEELKTKIDYIEKIQLQEKIDELHDFVVEHISTNHLENMLDLDKVVTYGNLKVNLSTSLKSLKEDAKAFIERIANEVKLIEIEETPSNLLYEYKNNGFDLTKAKLTLIERQKQIEELAKQREQVQEVVEQEEQVAEVVEEITMPKEIVSTTLGDKEEMLIVQFTVKGSKTQIIKLKEFIKELGVEYE